MNNGINTHYWGEGSWKLLHSMTFVYSDNPTEDEKYHFMTFFNLLQYTLPCNHCRQSYIEHINLPHLKIDDNNFKNKTNLTKWLYLLHECVNEDTHADYGMSYDDLCNEINENAMNCNLNKNECSNDNFVSVKSYKVYPLGYSYNATYKERNLMINDILKYKDEKYPDYKEYLKKLNYIEE